MWGFVPGAVRACTPGCEDRPLQRALQNLSTQASNHNAMMVDYAANPCALYMIPRPAACRNRLFSTVYP